MCSFRQSQTSHVILSTSLYVYMCKCAFFDDFILTNGIILAIKYTYTYLNNPLRHMSSYHEPHIRNMFLSRHSHTLHVLISTIPYVTCAHIDNPIRHVCSSWWFRTHKWDLFGDLTLHSAWRSHTSDLEDCWNVDVTIWAIIALLLVDFLDYFLRQSCTSLSLPYLINLQIIYCRSILYHLIVLLSLWDILTTWQGMRY